MFKNNYGKMFFWVKIIILFLVMNIGLKHGSFDFLKNYDADAYLKIAKYGYYKNLLYAFFPLYPILIRLFSYIFRSYVFSGIFINLVCSIINFKLIEKLAGREKLYIYIFSPILIFFSVIYTESLFLMLTLFAYYFYKKKNIYGCSISLGFSILTRNTGVLLFIAILIDYIYNSYKNKKINIKEFCFLIIIPSLIGGLYPLYLYIMKGDPLYFASVQYKYWGRENLFFVFGFINDIKYLISDNYRL